MTIVYGVYSVSITHWGKSIMLSGSNVSIEWQEDWKGDARPGWPLISYTDESAECMWSLAIFNPQFAIQKITEEANVEKHFLCTKL